MVYDNYPIVIGDTILALKIKRDFRRLFFESQRYCIHFLFRSFSKSQGYNIAQRDHLIQYMEYRSMFAAGKFSGQRREELAASQVECS